MVDNNNYKIFVIFFNIIFLTTDVLTFNFSEIKFKSLFSFACKTNGYVFLYGI